MQNIRWLAAAVLILFSGYTLYAAKTESFWSSLKKMMALKWGR